MKKPAILGGDVAVASLKPYNTIGEEEKKAACEVIDSGMLSGFIGAWVPEFYGGPKVRELEENWSSYFGVKHTVSVNSATSGLYAAIAAIGVEPGDEIIVTPTTMTATVTGILLYQAIPIFADICPHTYCLDSSKIEPLISSRTKAIIAVDLYGETAEWDALTDVAEKHDLMLIEDSAQSIGGAYNGRKSGTLADIGVFSLNRHKHIHCGEGGICVTDDDELAERMRLIRNHAEAVVGDKGTEDLKNLIGFNFRMTEIEAAIAVEQLKKLKSFVCERQVACRSIIKSWNSFDGLIPPIMSPVDDPSKYPGLARPADTTVDHVYYSLCFKFAAEKSGITRSAFVSAMVAEGFPITEGGYPPIYRQPLYQQQIAFGSNGHPFNNPYYGKKISYPDGTCPIAERIFDDELIELHVQSHVFDNETIEKMAEAAANIMAHGEEIRQYFSDRT